MRVVSLLPSATELLAALDVDPVGVSHSCDYPPHTRYLPTLTSTTVEYENRSSRDIDEQMQSVTGAVYDLDAAHLAELDPDLVVTQATCDVCAVDASAVFEAVTQQSLDADVLTLDPHSFDDALEDVVRVGEAIDERETATDLLGEWRTAVDAITSQVAGADRPRTAVFDWTDPPIRAGHWVREMVALAGGDASFQPDGPSTPVRWEDVVEYDPERLVVAPCGFDRDRAETAADELADRPGWNDLAAVRAGEVYAVDGNALFNRPGPRLVDSLRVLAQCLHPNAVDANDEWLTRVDTATKRA